MIQIVECVAYAAIKLYKLYHTVTVLLSSEPFNLLQARLSIRGAFCRIQGIRNQRLC